MKQYEGKGRNTKKKERGSMLKAQTTSSKSQKINNPKNYTHPNPNPNLSLDPKPS
jgi:hypothetical protein